VDKRGCLRFTEEARELLDPYYEVLTESPITPKQYGCMFYAPMDLWYKALGDSLALTDKDGLCGMDEGVIDERVAKLVIEQLKEQGITI
jgi:hypothetical protein